MYNGKVIDFHIHIGRREDWHPWVNDYFSGVNPHLFGNFDAVMNPGGIENYLKEQGVDFAVVLAEDAPLTTGVVTNSLWP